MAEVLFEKKPDRINEDENRISPPIIAKKAGILEGRTKKKVKFHQDSDEERPKSKKKVRINVPENSVSV